MLKEEEGKVGIGWRGTADYMRCRQGQKINPRKLPKDQCLAKRAGATEIAAKEMIQKASGKQNIKLTEVTRTLIGRD